MEERSDAETAFIVVKHWDGSWSTNTDLTQTFTVDRPAYRHDVKTGCREMYDFLSDDDTASLILSKFLEHSKPDSQRTADAIRHALTEREIL